jgi:hypothetical protein
MGSVPITRLSSRRGVWYLTIGLIAVIINLPVAHGVWTNYRLDKVGVTTTANVTAFNAIPPDQRDQAFFIDYKLPEEADPQQRTFFSQVDEETYRAAKISKTVDVVYLSGNPAANRVEGQVTHRLGLYIALFADFALLMALLLALKFGQRPKEELLLLLATADVVRCKPGGLVEPEGRDEYVVRGDVIEIGKGEIVLHAGAGREVRVVLGGYRNSVGYQQPAEVHGRVLPPD